MFLGAYALGLMLVNA